MSMVLVRTTVPLLLLLGPLSAVAVGAQPATDGPIAVLESYVGRYELTPSFHLTVTREGLALYVQATGQPRAQLTPRVAREFVIVGSSLRVIFSVREDTGEVLDLMFEQGGLGRRAVRLADVGSSPTSRQIDLPVDRLARYVGTYQEQPGFAITITRDGTQLWARLTDLPGESIFPETEREFFYRGTGARITFHLDDDGAVTALTLHQGGAEVEMIRVTGEPDALR